MQIRLYKNAGKGNFTLDPSAFPNNNSNISVAIPYDFDGDGDLDLCVGGRNVPQNYGLDPTSYLFVNDGKGHFTDMEKTKNPDIASIGMEMVSRILYLEISERIFICNLICKTPLNYGSMILITTGILTRS